MTRTDALRKLTSYGAGWCVVRWAVKFGSPTWTIESLVRAERAVDATPDLVRIIAQTSRIS